MKYSSFANFIVGVPLIFREICCLPAAGVISVVSITVCTIVFKVCVLYTSYFLLLVVSCVFDLISIVYHNIRSVCA